LKLASLAICKVRLQLLPQALGGFPISFLCVTRLIAPLVILALSTGCHRNTYYGSPSIDGLRFSADAAIVGDTLRVVARAENASTKVVELELSQCYPFSSLSVELRRRRRIWNSHSWEEQQAKSAALNNPYEVVCAGGVMSTNLSPGASVPFVLRIPVGAVLGDSLNAGSYRVVARLDVNGRRTKDIMAGAVDIAAPPDTR
jgi:hypothetical protein